VAAFVLFHGGWCCFKMAERLRALGHFVYDKVKDDPDWAADAPPCDHDAMLDMPDDVTRILAAMI
jgi:hypothetical protein